MHRLRIFAGPNGSGKSTLYKQLEGQFNLGHYLNPDDLHQKVTHDLRLDLSQYDISPKTPEWPTFWKEHGLCDKAPRLRYSQIRNNTLFFREKPKSYEAAILADFLRHQILRTGETFSFETVFSHPSKLEFMQTAIDAGYKCYLYFAAVSSPDISVARVAQRKQEGGHGVPEDKIRKRYTLTLENLLPAIQKSYRAYLFDNSQTMKLAAEVNPNGFLEIKGNSLPIWVEKYTLDKIKQNKD